MSVKRKSSFLINYKQYRSEIHRYIALLILPLMLVIALFFCVNIVITRQIDEQGAQIVHHFRVQSDSILREMEIVSDSILNDSNFYNCISNNVDFQPIDMCNIISKKVLESTYVSNAYVISESNKLIYSDEAYYSYEALSAILRQLFPDLDENTPVSLSAIDTGWHLSEGNYGRPYYVAECISGSETTEKLLVTVNMRAFLNTISEPNAILCCAFNDNVSFSSMLKSYPNMDWYSESAVQELVGTNIKCFYENGDGFTYMAAISTKSYYAPLRAIIYGFCIYFIAVAIIGYSYLYSVSRRRYKELVNMIDGLPQLSNTTSSFNEVVSALNNSLAEYKRNYAFQQRIDRRENLAKLLTGGLTESAALEQLNVAGLSQSDIGYYVVMASVDISLNMTLESSVTANTDVICLIFESSLNSLADGRLSVAVTNVPTMPRFYFFVLSILDDNFTPDDLREFLNNAIDVIEDKCTLKTSVTVSNPVTSASGLFDGYIECKKLSDFVHSIDSNATVVFQEDMQNDAGVLLNGDFLNQLQVLSRTLSVGKYELVPQLVEAMCSEHVAKLGKHYDLAHDRLWSIISILSEAISSSNLTESEKISASAQLHSVKSIAELNAITPKIFGNLSHSSDETGIDPLVKKACAYIDENISDSTLSVPQISSAVNVSVQHLSRLFKKDMDNTIVEYINYHRIEIAKKLLIEQNYTVSKIAESAGYNNTVTFTRNFKHYVGLSPSEYRNMNS